MAGANSHSKMINQINSEFIKIVDYNLQTSHNHKRINYLIISALFLDASNKDATCANCNAEFWRA